MEDKYREFKELVFLHILSVLKEFSNLYDDVILEIVKDALEQIVIQNYETVFFSRKNT